MNRRTLLGLLPAAVASAFLPRVEEDHTIYVDEVNDDWPLGDIAAGRLNEAWPVSINIHGGSVWPHLESETEMDREREQMIIKWKWKHA